MLKVWGPKINKIIKYLISCNKENYKNKSYHWRNGKFTLFECYPFICYSAIHQSWSSLSRELSPLPTLPVLQVLFWCNIFGVSSVSWLLFFQANLIIINHHHRPSLVKSVPKGGPKIFNKSKSSLSCTFWTCCLLSCTNITHTMQYQTLRI